MVTEKHRTNTEEETNNLGLNFAGKLRNGDIVAIYGELGTGKTEFIKGICSYFHVKDIVSSPTYTLINQYMGKNGATQLPIYHIDLYRVESVKDLEEIGFQECMFDDQGIKLVEWADKANGFLPKKGYRIFIEQNDDDENERAFRIEKIG